MTGSRETPEGLLAELVHQLIRSDPPSYERAWNRYLDHDRRFAEDGPVRRHYFTTMQRVGERLRQQPAEAALLLDARGDQVQALLATLERLAEEQPRGEECFRRLTLPPELVMLLAQKLGLFREDYLRFVESLPRLGRYAPRYLNFGPSGLCNLRCCNCILWGALFQNRKADGVVLEQLLAHLDDAERLGLCELSFCIGEPTYDLPYLDRVLERVSRSPTLVARSFVTNGLFGRKPERARQVWQRILRQLGPEKTARCCFAVSANPELVEQGVRYEHTIAAVAAFQEVMPNEQVLIQLIGDETYLDVQAELLDLLLRRGLLAGAAHPAGSCDRLIRTVRLAGGLELVFSVMAKMPAINSQGGELEEDPCVFYLNPDSLGQIPMPGLFMPMNADPLEGGASGEAERITLGPDGLFYADYHFMVRQVRPLGCDLPRALDSFCRDPILTRLQQVGGLNAVLAAYQRLPPEQRPILELAESLGCYSTVSMAAANVLFGDEDLALRLARFLVEEEEGAGS